MKKCILSAIGGAMAMFVGMIIVANISAAREQKPKVYKHEDYVSCITEAECFVCGNGGDSYASACWGEDNVGIVNLNTFEMMRLEINRYDDHGELIEEPAGYMSSVGLSDKGTDSYAHAYVFHDNAYASLQITGVQCSIDREVIQRRLCQTCLDSINGLWFIDQPPTEYAVISFEDRIIRPLLNTNPWFTAGNFGIDCEFKEHGQIDLLVHYCPNRYK